MNDRVEVLLKSIRNGTREEVWEAAKKIFDTSAGIALSLMRTLEEAEHADARAAAAWALGMSGFASARESLEEVVGNAEEECSVRSHAAEALAYIGDPRSVPLLIEHLGEKHPGIRYWCTFALGQIGDPQAVPSLRRIAESAGGERYEGHSLREEALDAISHIESGQPPGR
jgi:HEAT repeat protein